MRRDPHSFADDTQARTDSFDLNAIVDFATKTLQATVTLRFAAPATGRLDLDTRDLTIEGVEDAHGHVLVFALHAPEKHIGARLSIELAHETPSITIRYRTAPEASAMQWLAPSQTAGGMHPYVFTQCQAIHARSIIPLQDSPGHRVTYTATLTIPRELKVVMAAADRGRTDTGDVAVHRWEMPQRIPPYLFAFAAGDLASRDLSSRSRVWAEPSIVDAAAWEFAMVEDHITAAEALFGPYDWERFDILIMPPSFPYGGMENPRLTFFSPTTIAGDRSLVSVMAHELAHSWTGNLVTNANAEHFWLNEGFTMYAERRITEVTEGTDAAALSAALGRRELEESIARFADRPEMTKLRPNLTGVDPDDCYSLIPYEKGYFFLAAIENLVGRSAFEAWLKTYLTSYRFGAITTEEFEAHLEAALPGALAKANARAWIDGPGIPDGAVPPASAKLDAIEGLRGALPSREASAGWTATEWNLYLESVPRPAPDDVCRGLDAQLTASKNYDVLVAWLTLALQSGYHAILPRVEQVVAHVGRMKFLRPMYTNLANDARTRDLAAQLYAKNRASYHPIARQMVEGVLAKQRP
ncbi:MAG: M1 family metallopeptidase [Kofleriaceae bacterium]